MDGEQQQIKAAIRSPCSLRQACQRAGLYQDGERCPDCLLRRLCQSERRWLIKADPEPLCH